MQYYNNINHIGHVSVHIFMVRESTTSFLLQNEFSLQRNMAQYV